jgi:hypothetical protein
MRGANGSGFVGAVLLDDLAKVRWLLGQREQIRRVAGMIFVGEEQGGHAV